MEARHSRRRAKVVEVTQREKPCPKEEPDDDITEQSDSTAFENNNTIAPTNRKTPSSSDKKRLPIGLLDDSGVVTTTSRS